MANRKDQKAAKMAWNKYENNYQQYDWSPFTINSLIYNAFLTGFYAGCDYEKAKHDE